MRTSFTKTELAELVSSQQKDINYLSEENRIKSNDIKSLREERNQLYHESRILKDQENVLRSKISRLRMKVGSQEDYIDDIVWFGWNFPYYGRTFIEEVWKGDGSLISHLQDKFSYRMDQDSKNGFFTFVSDLDEGNRHKLYEWILKNYSKKGRVRHTEEA